MGPLNFYNCNVSIGYSTGVGLASLKEASVGSILML